MEANPSSAEKAREFLKEGGDEQVVFREPSTCLYFSDRTALTPLRRPLQHLSPRLFDKRLAQGDRRSGTLLYRPECPTCQACQPIRLRIDDFRFSKSQRRIMRRNDDVISIRLRDPQVDQAHVDLYNKHLRLRDLRVGTKRTTEQTYRNFLVERSCASVELQEWMADELVGVAITDIGAESLSAHYTFYDPDRADMSLGTYAILKQVLLARAMGKRYLYLGYYIAGHPHMSYKARFHPHERLVRGEWRVFPGPVDK